MKQVTRLFVVILIAALLAPVAYAEIPRLLSYQGVLCDTAGNPKPDGAYSLTFRLYSAPTGGTALWTETKTLSVERGLFSTILGDVTPFGAALTFGQRYWLSIQVASQPQMSPRIPLTPVGYSLNSIKSDTAMYARSAPLQPMVDSARVSGTSHVLHLPSLSAVSGPEYGLLIDNAGTGDGIRVYSRATAWNYAAVFGANVATSGAGVGVYGYSMEGPGVYANSQDNDGIEATTLGPANSGVFAHADNGYGATCRSTANFGARVGGGGDASANDFVGDVYLEGNRGEVFTGGTVLNLFSNGWVALDLDNDNNGSHKFEIWSGTDALVYTVDESGNTVATGTKSAMVHTDTHGDRLVYATESPEVWLEDVGASHLLGGMVKVAFESVFAQTINPEVPYHVFVTPTADQPVVLFVAEKTTRGFTVKGVGLDGQPVNCAFDYRIIAKRRGHENTRLAPVDPSDNSRRAVMPISPVTAPAAPAASPLKDKSH